MRFKKGDVVWRVPIRYWEDQTPERCVVVSDDEASHPARDALEHADVCKGLLVFHEGYGHEVYVPHDGVYYVRANAIVAALAKKRLHDLESADFAEYVTDTVAGDGSPPMERDAWTPEQVERDGKEAAQEASEQVWLALAERVKQRVVRPVCVKHNLTYVAANGTHAFVEDAGKGRRVWSDEDLEGLDDEEDVSASVLGEDVVRAFEFLSVHVEGGCSLGDYLVVTAEELADWRDAAGIEELENLGA